MSSLQLTNPHLDDINETKTFINKAKLTTRSQTRSHQTPWIFAFWRSPMKVSFAFDASLMQASNITPGNSMHPHLDDEDIITTHQDCAESKKGLTGLLLWAPLR